MNRTILEIAEELRQHCNRDNDAPRLIAEHVLPLLGVDMTLQELRRSQGAEDDFRDAAKTIETIRKDLTRRIYSLTTDLHKLGEELMPLDTDHEEIVGRLADLADTNEGNLKTLAEFEEVADELRDLARDINP